MTLVIASQDTGHTCGVGCLSRAYFPDSISCGLCSVPFKLRSITPLPLWQNSAVIRRNRLNHHQKTKAKDLL